MKEGLAIFCFGLCSLAVSLNGLLMCGWPERYVGMLNWYYTKMSMSRRAPVEKYSQWGYRLSGFMQFLMSFVCYYALWSAIKGHLLQ